MKVLDLINLLVEYDEDMEICIDIDDGIKGNFKDILRISTHTGATGLPFLSIDADWIETNKHFKPEFKK